MPLLALEQQTLLVRDFLLSGKSEKELAKEYNISTRAVSSIVTDRVLVSEAHRNFLDVTLAKENKKIAELKSEVLGFFSDSIQELKTQDNKVKYTQDVILMLSTIDKIMRLNSEKPTEITNNTQTTTTVDVAQILHELQTPEQKRAFLLSGMKNQPHDAWHHPTASGMHRVQPCRRLDYSSQELEQRQAERISWS